MEADGRLKLVCVYPEAATLEDHLITMKAEIDAFDPHRVAIDSLSALERVASIKSFREFVISLTSFIKHRELAGLFTATTPELMGGTSVSEAHISSITDSIILLRYVEIFGEMRRGLAVLKMRGSMHQKEIREFTIDGNGHAHRPGLPQRLGHPLGPRGPCHLRRAEPPRRDVPGRPRAATAGLTGRAEPDRPADARQPIAADPCRRPASPRTMSR